VDPLLRKTRFWRTHFTGIRFILLSPCCS
jgi:hypothetical protein